MTTRRAVVDALEAISFGAQMKGDRRARSWGQASWAIRNLSGDLAAMLASGELLAVRGVGRGSAAVVQQVLAGKEPDALTKLRAELPAGLFQMRRLKGLGPKKVKQLWTGLGLSDLSELEYACRENRLVTLDGFGAKTQAKILAQIQHLRETEGLLRRDQARALHARVSAALEAHAGVSRVAVVGDYAMGAELVRPALLVEGDDVADALSAVSAEERGIVSEVGVEGFGFAALLRTAAAEHLELLAARAEARGLRWSDAIGLEGCDEELESADDVYRALGLLPTAPERRLPGVPLVEAGHAAPALLRRADLRGALHNHTIESDGTHTLEAMRDGAAARGLAYLGITEHSVTASYARGLERERLDAQREAIARLNAAGDSSCVVLTGIESDILEHGQLDYEDDVLSTLDVVVASVHRRHGQGREAMTARMTRAARHAYADVIGHPTGRLLLGRAPTDVDIDALLDACRQGGTAIELNAQPQRLDLAVENLGRARERGVLVSIAADAHSVEALDYLDHGVAVARRAGLCAEDVLNARSLVELRAWLGGRRAAARV